MKISISQNVPNIKICNQTNKNSSLQAKKSDCDVFTPVSTHNNKKRVSFSGNSLSSLFGIKRQKKYHSTKQLSQFAIDTAYGANRVTGCNNPVENFECVMSPEEFRELLPSLSQENFISSKENMESGIYCADLDYQTTFSSGTDNIYDILEKVSQYANNYYSATGKDFLFAITDRDSLEGIQHALRIISSEPDKYKHLKILPGIKMSFAHKAPNSNLGFENSDMLIYGINPYSQNIMDFVDSTISGRKKMMVDFIKEINGLYPEFSYNVLEFAKQNKIKYKKSFGVSNLYWRAREYAETKGDTEIKGISMAPEDIIKEANAILDELEIVYLGSEQEFSGLGSDIITDEEVNKSIKGVFEKYSTHYDDKRGKVVSAAENLYNDMIDCLSKEKEKPVLAIASPYYFSHYYEKRNPNTFEKVVRFFRELQDESNGMIMAFESEVPSYDIDKNLTKKQVEEFNDYIRKHTKLYEVGGSFAAME